MSLHRHAAKRDKNESEIIDALKAVGAQVYPLSAKGVPDLLVAYRNQTYLLETKSKGGKLTADQMLAFGSQALLHGYADQALAVARTALSNRLARLQVLQECGGAKRGPARSRRHS